MVTALLSSMCTDPTLQWTDHESIRLPSLFPQKFVLADYIRSELQSIFKGLLLFKDIPKCTNSKEQDPQRRPFYDWRVNKMYLFTWFPLSSMEFPPPPYLPAPFISIIVVTVVILAIAAALILLLFWSVVVIIVADFKVSSPLLLLILMLLFPLLLLSLLLLLLLLLLFFPLFLLLFRCQWILFPLLLWYYYKRFIWSPNHKRDTMNEKGGRVIINAKLFIVIVSIIMILKSKWRMRNGW